MQLRRTHNTTDTILTYDNQLHFKRWAYRKGLTFTKAPYYFDCIDAVDDRKGMGQKDIDGVKADGTLTFGEATARLKAYFNIA